MNKDRLMTEDRLLSDREVSGITGRARSTLQKDRWRGEGIPFLLLGRSVKYKLSDVREYIKSLETFTKTDQYTVGK